MTSGRIEAKEELQYLQFHKKFSHRMHIFLCRSYFHLSIILYPMDISRRFLSNLHLPGRSVRPDFQATQAINRISINIESADETRRISINRCIGKPRNAAGFMQKFFTLFVLSHVLASRKSNRWNLSTCRKYVSECCFSGLHWREIVS